MSEAYKKVNSGRLSFKGGELAAIKSLNKKKHKKKQQKQEDEALNAAIGDAEEEISAINTDVYTIDAAKKMKYEEIFPVETRKFGYDPANKSRSGDRAVEEALDDRVKRKADRYCK